MIDKPTPATVPQGAEIDALIREAIDLLTERKHGSSARSPGFNARLVLERALASLRPAEPLPSDPMTAETPTRQIAEAFMAVHWAWRDAQVAADLISLLDAQAAAFAERMDAARKVIMGASHALRSYEHGDSADACDAFLASTGTTDGEKAKTPLPQARENVEGMDD